MRSARSAAMLPTMSTNALFSHRAVRGVWKAAHAPVAGAPRWACLAAYAIPLTVLPSSRWRIAAYTFHVPIADGPTHAASGISGVSLEVSVVLLYLLSESAAFVSCGLIANWGEMVPLWVPVLGGRSIPRRPVVVAGWVAAAVLTLLWTWVAVTFALGERINGRAALADAPLNFHDWRGVLAVAAYAPLVLWGPLLAAVTASYHRRRG